MFNFFSNFLIAISISTICALYSPSDDVIELTDANFNQKVIQSDDVWLVEFYAPWCGHCQALAPEWKKAASALKGIVKIGAADMDKHPSVGSPYNVRGFPTIKIFASNKNAPQDFNGQRTAQAIVSEAMRVAQQVVNDRLGGRGGGGGRSGGGGSGGDTNDVVELTDTNFDKLVLQSEEPWLVEFFAPWCGHCKNLAPHWAKAATELKGKLKLGALDATVHTVISQKYGVQGFPTIKFFPAGKKVHFTPSDALDYDGGRTADDIVRWGNNKALESLPPPEVYQVINEKVVSDVCEGHQLCIIGFLPNILDCQSKCRNDYLKVMQDMAERHKRNHWGWLWAEAGQQMALEESLGIGGFGYPAMVAMNYRKMKYALLKGSFGSDGIHEFLRELSYGRGSTAPVADGKIAKINTIEAWDGKDGKMPEEEDIDLSDVELEPLDDKKKSEL